ncbi:MAG: Obg family GTPase CgtA [Planctomycetota bacterium]
MGVRGVRVLVAKPAGIWFGRGDGGDIVIEAVENLTSLYDLVGHKHWNAGRGAHGMGKLMQGANGADAVIAVPPGTLIKDVERGHTLKDLASPGDRVVIAKGGRGGRGNKHFATATHRAPRECEPGGEGESRQVLLELKLIADVGLVGLPNAGKSTLLSRLSAARPEIADYPFTTKTPNLGVVRVGWEREFVLADIPGLIEGAHAGVGLGHEFLRHVERTRVLVHLVEPTPVDGSDPLENYKQIREELRLYNASLEERPEIVCVSKCELPDAEPLAELFEEEHGFRPLLISSAVGTGLKELTAAIFERLDGADAT